MIIGLRIGTCDVLEDTTISFDAKGLYSTIKFYIEQGTSNITKELLMSSCKDTEEVFDNAWLELVEHGYIIKVPEQNGYELLVSGI